MEIPTHSYVVVDIVKEGAFISHSNKLETLLKLLNSVFIKGVQSIAPIHLQLPLSHLFGLLYLHGV